MRRLTLRSGAYWSNVSWKAGPRYISIYLPLASCHRVHSNISSVHVYNNTFKYTLSTSSPCEHVRFLKLLMSLSSLLFSCPTIRVRVRSNLQPSVSPHYLSPCELAFIFAFLSYAQRLMSSFTYMLVIRVHCCKPCCVLCLYLLTLTVATLSTSNFMSLD